jgi:hypothetical protein
MVSDALQATTIEKEIIATLHFPKDNLWQDDERDVALRRKLWSATRLGNLEHNKVKLYFEDDHGMKMVHTTVWATGEKNIVLKGGVTIPIHRIHRIDTL